MSTYRLTVNESRFYLSPEDDVETLKTALLAAISGGAGFIDLFNSARVKVALLVTAHTHVQIEEFDSIDDVSDLWQQPEASSMFNFDEWDITTAQP
ncbi:hypothetical protein [Subtercola sp. RTI3]|uniref:hypothetical protein n=1 Tax=Subtercola sp. RTI3 TaxID=3048639 RepID=UPI002B233E02|nr:hypothetical protein [Subtercola sp. RTI3]MEA9987247.1 hypothetical protein [Subtercola sp. RTI3]